MVSLELPPIFADLQIPLLYLTNILTLAAGPRRYTLRVLLSLPTVVVLVSQSLYRQWPGTWGNHYAVNCLVCSAVATYVDWILLSSPDTEGWRKIRYEKGKEEDGMNGKSSGTARGVTNSPTKKGEQPVVPQHFWSRLWWAVRLATTNRYVGWSCQVKNVPMEVDADYSRLLFIARKTLRAIIFYVMKDAIYAYTASSSHGSWEDSVQLKPVMGFPSFSFWHRFWFTWVHIMLTCVSMEFFNCAYGIVSVGTGLANPRDCPSAFGALKNLWSVRNAWSSVWHQQCRRICSAPSIFIARDLLRLPKGSFASKYVQLFIAFGISAIVHGCGSMLVHRSIEDDAAFVTFLSQAVIIMIEDHLIDIGKSLGFKDSTVWRTIGFIWTMFVIGATMQRWSGSVIGHGMWIHQRERDFFGIGPD